MTATAPLTGETVMQRRRTIRTRFFKPIPLIAMLLAILLPGQQIFAFWPTNIRVILVPGISFFDETHESITKSAMKELDNEFFSITNLTSSMKDAISEAADNNAKVDKDQKNGFLHFDGESFINGQNRLVQSKTAVINLLKNSKDGSAARAALGGALHTLQDFYSHSDWVELGNSGPNTAITSGGGISFSPPTERTCAIVLGIATGTIVSSNLTSGYYHGENEVKPSPDPGKCNH